MSQNYFAAPPAAQGRKTGNAKFTNWREAVNSADNCGNGKVNLLRNVGPQPDGVIDSDRANRFMDIGAWLARFAV
jgi:alpha-L-fucosidase